MRFVEPLAPEAAARTAKAFAGQLRANRTPQVAEGFLTDPSVSPGVRNSILLGLLDAQGPEEWKTGLPRLLELSDDAHRQGNVKTWFEWWSVQRADAAGAFIDAMPADAPERDSALAGHAIQMARNNRSAAASDLAGQIADTNLRSETLFTISKEAPPDAGFNSTPQPKPQEVSGPATITPAR